MGYSNILEYRVFSLSVDSDPVIIELNSENSLCSPSGGIIKEFDISAAANQTCRSLLKVMNYYGSGFVFKILDRSDDSELFSWDGGPVGTSTEYNFILDGNGSGQYKAELCLNECVGVEYVRATVKLNLYQSDNQNLSDQSIELSYYHDCDTGIFEAEQ